MPNIGFFHPLVVHFVVGIVIVGVLFRLLWITGRMDWAGPSATVLILLGTCASVVAVQSGTDAHELAEQMPGARPAVQTHEDWGHYTRNVFLGISALELLAFVPGAAKFGKGLRIASGVVGIAGVAVMAITADKGGDLVYNFAGGVGVRSGDTADVSNLLTAGLYNEANVDRKAKRGDDAARLIDELALRHPADASIALMKIQSTLVDRNDPAAARAALVALTFPKDSARLYLRHEMLLADVLEAMGHPDSAKTVLTTLATDIPRAKRMVDARLARMK